MYTNGYSQGKLSLKLDQHGYKGKKMLQNIGIRTLIDRSQFLLAQNDEEYSIYVSHTAS
jgi:hypothetical protein